MGMGLGQMLRADLNGHFIFRIDASCICGKGWRL